MPFCELFWSGADKLASRVASPPKKTGWLEFHPFSVSCVCLLNKFRLTNWSTVEWCVLNTFTWFGFLLCFIDTDDVGFLLCAFFYLCLKTLSHTFSHGNSHRITDHQCRKWALQKNKMRWSMNLLISPLYDGVLTLETAVDTIMFGTFPQQMGVCTVVKFTILA